MLFILDQRKHIDSGTIAINWKKIFFLRKSNSVENMTEHWLCVVQTWKGFSSTICAVTVRRTSICRAGGAGPTTPTLVGPKILPFMVKALYFQSFGRTNNCQIDALIRSSDQSFTPSAASDMAELHKANLNPSKF